MTKPAPPQMTADRQIARDAEVLSAQLSQMRDRLFPPTATKKLRAFTSGEAAKLIGVSDGYLRQLSIAGDGPSPAIGNGGKRTYTLAQINALRTFLDARSRGDRRYVPHRNPMIEHCQIIALTNFKGGSGKTTTTTHLAQHLALQGYRVLAIDLDPQASMSSLFGYQPELDLEGNDTIYGAIRYDDERRPLSEIIRPTYVDGLDLVPGNLELQEYEHTTPRMLATRGESGNPDDPLFFARVQRAIASVADDYDVVVLDCPPQLGFLTLGALCAATSVIVTVHPQMLDVASMSQFLFMTADLLAVVREAGGRLDFDFMNYLVTRYEPADGPQTQIAGFLRAQFGDRVLTNAMVKSTAISDAGLTKQTLYEVGRENFSRNTYDRAMEALTGVNGEIEGLIVKAWGRDGAQGKGASSAEGSSGA